MPIMIPPASPTGILQYHWIDPTDASHPLYRDGSPDIFVPKGAVGLGYVSSELALEKLPANAGALLRHINIPVRKIELPIFVKTETIGDLAEAMETLYDWFATGDESFRDPGYFVVIRPDDSVRQIACYYAGGLEGDMEPGGPGWTKVVVSLIAPDPYPTAGGTITLHKTVGEAASFVVLNDGRLPSQPQWKIHGPFTNGVTITNTTTGKSLTAGPGLTINSTQFIIIDTRPAEERTTLAVYDNLGNNILYIISPTSEFFPLGPGSNTITVSFLSGGTDANTYVELIYLPKYRSLLR